MSYTNFLLNGANGQLVIMQRAHFPVDPKPVCVGTSNSFQGKITQLQQDGQTKSVIVDNAVMITTISDKIRHDCASSWHKLKNSTKVTFIATLIGGISGIVSALAMGILVPPLFSVALTTASLALVLLGVSCLSKLRSNQADEQLALWAEPLQGYLEQRKSLSTEGLGCIIANESLKNLASEDELVSLWKAYHLEFKNKASLLNKEGSVAQKGQFVEDFFEKGPYSSTIKKLALQDDDNQIPGEYKPGSSKYTKVYLKHAKIKIASLESQSKVHARSAAAMQSTLDRQKAYENAMPRIHGDAAASLSRSLHSLSNTIDSTRQINRITMNGTDEIRGIQSEEYTKAAELFPEVYELLH